MGKSISLNILISYTIPLTYLMSIYIIYTVLHVLLLLDNAVYVLILLLHYVPALVYVVHKIAVNFNIGNILVSTLSFLLFPVHFTLTLYYKIMFSLKFIKVNPSQIDETSALLTKIRPDSPFHTFLICFTCVQIPVEVFLQMALYLSHFRNGTRTTILTIANLTVSLLLITYGAVAYFRYETQNINQYLLNRATLRRVNAAKVQAERTYRKPGMAQFKVESKSNVIITDFHSIPFKLIVSVMWLTHNYIRLVSVGLVLFFYPTFTIIFLTAQTVVFFLILLFSQLRSGDPLNLGYTILQSFVLNFCLIEYKIKQPRKLISLIYFAIILAENLLFNYLWFTVNWSRRYKTLFTATICSLAICQIIQTLLLFVYWCCYKPRVYEIDYYAGDTEDEGIEANASENEEESQDDAKVNRFHSQSGRYETAGKQSEGDRRPAQNVDRIRTSTLGEKKEDASQIKLKPVAYAEAQNHSALKSGKQDSPKQVIPAKPSSLPGTATAAQYKALINDVEERTIYSQPVRDKMEEHRKSLSVSYGINPEQRDSWKYIVEEIDDQIHKSTSNLNKGKLHLSRDRLNSKHNRSTDSLDHSTSRGNLSLPATQLIPSSSETQRQNLVEASFTKSYSNVKQSGQGHSDERPESFHSGTSVDPIETIDRNEEEEIVLEKKFVSDAVGFDKRTSRYSSQEFVETRRVNETSYEERKMNVKKLNTTSLV